MERRVPAQTPFLSQERATRLRQPRQDMRCIRANLDLCLGASIGSLALEKGVERLKER